MQIKPGILVMLLPTPNEAHRAHAGEIHVVGEWVPDVLRWCPEGGGWRMDPPIFDGTANLWWSAAFLRPIDNPGDDQRDETLEWLPSPQMEDRLVIVR